MLLKIQNRFLDLTDLPFGGSLTHQLYTAGIGLTCADTNGILAHFHNGGAFLITQGKYSLREHGRGTGAAHTVDP